LGQPFIWVKSWKTKANREYNQSLLRLFGTPCCLIGSVAATWHTCDYYFISESLTHINEHIATVALSLAVTANVSLVWCVQQFFHIKFQILTDMPRTNVTLADRIALLENIKNQLPNTSHHHLAEIAGMPKSTITHVIQQREKL
jgi:hypothetical protein